MRRGIGQQARRIGHVPGHVARVVDDDVPAAAGQCVEAVVAVADIGPEIGEQVVVRAAAVEQLHGVAAAQRLAHHVWPDETGPAEDE